MRTLLGAVLVLGWVSAVATAAPHSVLVLPLDGNVDATTRGKLNAEVVRLAKQIPGTVNVADTTFEETAAAVGCEVTAPACAETVRSTLGVDELVYGRASNDGSQTTLVVHRIVEKKPREATATLAPADDPSTAGNVLAPLFDARPSPDLVAKVPPVKALDPPPPQTESPSPPGRTRGILLTAGGGAAIAVGIGLWISTRSDQSNIDDANPSTADEFRALHDKEDRVQRTAIIGDVLVGVGAGLATWGIITLVQSRHADSVVVAPSVSTDSASVVLGGTW